MSLRWRLIGFFAVLGIIAGIACPEPIVNPIDGDDAGIDAPDASVVSPCEPNCLPPPPPPPPPPEDELSRIPAANPIPAENQKPGDWSWRAGTSATNGELDLYTSIESVEVGDSIAVKVSSSVQLQVTAEVFRLGWYGGAGARKVWTGGPYTAKKQAPCPLDESTGLIECDWEDTFSFEVDPAWPSGMYVVKVRRPDGFKRFSPFVVRDRRAAEVLYTPNFTTWQAYNTWGGESLYYDASGKMPSGRAHLVSFNRPYKDIDGLGKTFNLDLALLGLLEKHGYDVTYATQLDFNRFNDVLKGISAFVHGGQDEYWLELERNQVDEALASGKTSLAYFGGNGAYWRMRLLPDAKGNPNRIIACYKSEPKQDPLPYSTVRFRDAPNARPENNLFGVMYEGWQIVPFPIAVTDTSHWLFEGTKLSPGTLLQGMVGYEYDRAFPELSGYPSGVRTILKSPVVSAEGIPSYTTAVERTLPSGTLVFSAGTIWWPIALGPVSELKDGRVERMTLNVLERALQHRRPRRLLPEVTGPFPTVSAPQAVWAQSVTQFIGQAGRPGYVDGPGNEARFKSPTGLAALPSGELVIADTGNNRLRLVAADDERTVTTMAGNGDLGYRDGEGSQAMFRMPTDVAVGPGGVIYVADSDNHVIRKLERVGTTWTVSTVAGKGFSAGYADGVGTNARFNRPTSLAVDAAGNLYVADQVNNRIRKIDPVTQEVTTIAGTGGWGRDDAVIGTQATLAVPSAIDVAPTGELYFLDSNTQLIRRISTTGTYAVSTVAGDPNAWFGFQDGAGDTMRARAQMGLTVSEHGEVMFADTANFRIRKVVPGVTSAQSQVYTIAGSGKVGTAVGPGDRADVTAPTGLTFGPDENLYVSDSFHHVILQIIR